MSYFAPLADSVGWFQRGGAECDAGTEAQVLAKHFRPLGDVVASSAFASDSGRFFSVQHSLALQIYSLELNPPTSAPAPTKRLHRGEVASDGAAAVDAIQ